MQTTTLSWHNELKYLLFTRDAYHRLWQIAFFAALMIPYMLVGHRTAADVLCGLIGVLFLLKSATKKEWGWLREPMMMALFATRAWMVLVVTPFAYDPYTSFTIAFPWIRFIPFFAAMRHWVLTEAGPIKFLGLWVALLLIFICVDTVWQYVHGVSLSNNYMDDSGRLTGAFSNVKVGIYLARMVLPALGICLFFSLKETRSKLAFITYCMLYVFVLVTIAFSGERAPLGVTVISTLILLGILAVTEKNLRRVCLVLTGLLIGILDLLLLTQNWVQERFLYTVELLSDFWNTSYGQLFRMAYDMGKNHPIAGIGMKNFRDLSEIYVADGLATHSNLHPHHPYLEWFAEAGSVGLILFLIFVGMVFVQVIKTVAGCTGPQRIIAAFVLGSVMLLLFPLVPTQSFFANWPAILFWYSLSVALSSLALCRSHRPA